MSPQKRDWQSLWREQALELVPKEYHEAAAACRGNPNPMQVFFEVLPSVCEAHQSGDEARLKAIYRFAQWCLDQPEKQIWNPAGVAFYEHLFEPGTEAGWHDRSRFIGSAAWETVLALSEFLYGSAHAERLKAFRRGDNSAGGRP